MYIHLKIHICRHRGGDAEFVAALRPALGVGDCGGHERRRSEEFGDPRGAQIWSVGGGNHRKTLGKPWETIGK